MTDLEKKALGMDEYGNLWENSLSMADEMEDYIKDYELNIVIKPFEESMFNIGDWEIKDSLDRNDYFQDAVEEWLQDVRNVPEDWFYSDTYEGDYGDWDYKLADITSVTEKMKEELKNYSVVFISTEEGLYPLPVLYKDGKYEDIDKVGLKYLSGVEIEISYSNFDHFEGSYSPATWYEPAEYPEPEYCEETETIPLGDLNFLEEEHFMSDYLCIKTIPNPDFLLKNDNPEVKEYNRI